MWSIATIQVTIVLVRQFVYPLLPGCYQRNITYINGLTQEGVSMYQIVSLIELAAYCEQEIRYDCILAPLTAEDVDYAFWEDRQGETNVYYTGQLHPEIQINMKIYQAATMAPMFVTATTRPKVA